MVRRSAVAFVVAVASLWAASGTSASRPPTEAAPSQLPGSALSSPQVVCAITYGPIGQAKFAYRTRPHTCLFHKPGTPVDEADVVSGKQIHWLSWGKTVAVGKGKSAENMVGLIPIEVKLTNPLPSCGHTVFSKARFKFPTVGRGYGRPVPLDHSLGNC